MKRKLFIFTLLASLILTLTPLVATPQFELIVNGVPYTPGTPLIMRDDRLYITPEDASDILLTPYVMEDLVDDFKDAMIYQNGIAYMPVYKLSSYHVDAAFTPATATLSLTTEAPFSQNRDNYEKHTFEAATYNLINVPSHVPALSSEAAFAQAIEDATSENAYIGFLDSEAYKRARDVFDIKFDKSPYNNIYLTFRTIDQSSFPHQLTQLETIPVTVEMTREGLALTLEDETCLVDSFWTMFYPNVSLTEADLHKSVDTTLMMFFYNYYCTRYDLRDDTYFSPFITIEGDRTHTLEHGVYSLTHQTLGAPDVQTDYLLKLYRVHPSGSMHFIIDLVAPATPSIHE